MKLELSHNKLIATYQVSVLDNNDKVILVKAINVNEYTIYRNYFLQEDLQFYVIINENDFFEKILIEEGSRIWDRR